MDLKVGEKVLKWYVREIQEEMNKCADWFALLRERFIFPQQDSLVTGRVLITHQIHDGKHQYEVENIMKYTKAGGGKKFIRYMFETLATLQCDCCFNYFYVIIKAMIGLKITD